MDQQQMEESSTYFTVVDFARLIDELGASQAMYELIKVLNKKQANDLRLATLSGGISTSD
jgi:hypothetical protein